MVVKLEPFEKLTYHVNVYGDNNSSDTFDFETEEDMDQFLDDNKDVTNIMDIKARNQ